MDFVDIFPAVREHVASTADALLLPPRRGVDYRTCSRWIMSRL
jgi:hypothetical protein